ncbi:TonB-dependent receptor domain-containing protein [Idiomarina sp.]|uniref:TonB-dependent receptor n=1 Tax=Idiomarina sp. TaxID=1874361 RepID=UPI003518377C
MKFNSKVSRISAAIALAVGMSTSVMAQETSSSMRGVITGPQGNPVANTKIVVTHEPTGTVNEFVTSADGTFTAKGLRVGGPYTVVIDSDKFQDAELENLYLSLGQTLRVTSQLKSADMERISVTGSVIRMEGGGASSNFSEETIDNMPSLNRDLKDIARINPLVSVSGNGEMSVAGGDPRSNSITVDGIGQNDDFGLNYGGYPTEQPPVSLSAIEQISVDVAPFSVKKGDFSGGTINAVTKSGTNEFEGELFYEFSNPSMKGDVDQLREVVDQYGDNIVGEDGYRQYEVESVEPNQKKSTFGLTFGGPLIKDELFFFTSYEEWSNEYEMDYGFRGSNATNELNVTQAQYDQFLDILSNYGLSDSIGGNPEDKDRKWLAKVSWNVNDDHRLDFTYQWQDNADERNYATGGDYVSLNSRRYTYHTRMNNFSLRLYSDWSANFISEIGVTYKDVESNSLTRSDLGAIRVETNGYESPAFEFGTDEYRHANVAKNDNLTFNFDGTYLLGDHEIVFGTEIEQLSLYNKFVPNSLGSWDFDYLDDFEAGIIGQFRDEYDFSYQNAYTNNPEDAAYEVDRTTYAFYLGDKFYPTADLELSAGIRYEKISTSDTPTLNQNFVDTYGYTNQENLDGLDIVLPRVSFKYYTDSSLVIRGGLGRFYGGVPNVWYTNPFTKDGITLVSAPESAIVDYFEGRSGVDFTQVPQPIQDSLEKGAGSVNYTDPNFEIPSDWRAQLAFDYEFDIPMVGEGFSATSSLLYIRKKDEPVWYNTAIEQVGTAADGERIIYESVYEGDRYNNFDIMLTNAPDDGRSFIFTQSLAKRWQNGFSFRASYAYQDVEDNGAGSSSQAESNYKYYVAANRNQATVSTGSYEVEHSLKITLGYEKEFFDGYSTNFNLFFERRSGRPFSYVMGMYRDGDFGDTRDFNTQTAYLPYIPTGPNDPNVDWSNSVSWEELSQVLANAGVEPGGYILDRNSFNQPWVTSLDLSIKQEIPGFSDEHRGMLYFTIDNFANLLNSDWGVEKRLSYPQVALYDLGGLSDDGKYQIDSVFGGYPRNNFDTIDLNSSSWSVKLGVRYEF